MPELSDRSLGARTTLRVGGEARRFLEVTDVGELERIASELAEGEPVFVLGRGSNTLVADAGFDGTVLHLGEGFSTIDFATEGDHCFVHVGAGVDLPVLARRCVEQGLAGFTWAVGVPGSLGGAVRMNAGGHGSDMSESIVSVTVFDLATKQVVEKTLDDLDFSYRHSSIASTDVVVAARLRLMAGDKESEREKLSAIVQWRRANQPGGSNCGSVFTNPNNTSAGALIEQAGLKGFRIGSAAVSSKHANFIQADQGGSGEDVAELIRVIEQRVKQTSGVHLQTEVRLLGFEDLV